MRPCYVCGVVFSFFDRLSVAWSNRATMDGDGFNIDFECYKSRLSPVSFAFINVLT